MKAEQDDLYMSSKDLEELLMASIIRADESTRFHPRLSGWTIPR
jgi:hypothetical protein